MMLMSEYIDAWAFFPNNQKKKQVFFLNTFKKKNISLLSYFCVCVYACVCFILCL